MAEKALIVLTFIYKEGPSHIAHSVFKFLSCHHFIYHVSQILNNFSLSLISHSANDYYIYFGKSFNMAPWADQPFNLIPIKSLKSSSEDAKWVASEMAYAHNGLLRVLNSIYSQAPYVKLEADIHDLLQYSIFWVDWIEGTLLSPASSWITSQEAKEWNGVLTTNRAPPRRRKLLFSCC
jgi:hypothetical protein